MKWGAALVACIALFGCGKAKSTATGRSGATLDRRGTLTVCQTHQVPLVEETQQAMPRFTVSWEPEFEKAMLAEFPNLGHAFGIRDLDVKWVIVRYCPKCREARDQWLRARRAKGTESP